MIKHVYGQGFNVQAHWERRAASRPVFRAAAAPVNPGFGGQTFIASAVDKVTELKAMIGSRPIRIEVDGGITPETAGLVAAAGADTLVAGSAIFKGGPGQYALNIGATLTSTRSRIF